jgi:asparagine synthase (glutamine-hydrolysing)
VLAVFDKLLWHYDEPFNDYSYLPTFYVCREARQAITVALSGDGGDELFGGYSKYKRLRLREQAGQLLMPAAASGIASILPRRHRLQKKLAAYRKDLSGALVDTLTTAFSAGDIRAAARGPLAEALRHFDPRDTVQPLLRKASPERVGAINSMRYLDLKLTLAGDMLVKVDRASMAVALEVRPVYLHRTILDMAARIPPGLLADRRESKKVLKSALRPWLPDSILYRPKMGFAMPLQQWMGGELRSAFGAEDRNSPIADWLDVGRLQTLADRQRSDSGGSALLAHNLVFLGRWAEKWLAGVPSPAVSA